MQGPQPSRALWQSRGARKPTGSASYSARRANSHTGAYHADFRHPTSLNQVHAKREDRVPLIDLREDDSGADVLKDNAVATTQIEDCIAVAVVVKSARMSLSVRLPP
jgi:hypothetical protein